MKYTDPLLYGKKQNRTLVDISMGVPDTLAVLENGAQLKPHIAIVNDEWWFWSVATQTWVKFIGATTGGGGDPTISLKTIHIWTGSPKVINQPQENNLIWLILFKCSTAEAAVRVGTTLNGEEIMFEQPMPQNIWVPILVQIPTPIDLHITGVTGQGTIVLYKEIII